MRNIFWSLVIVLTFCHSWASNEAELYGDKISNINSAVTLDEAISSLEAQENKKIVLKAKVAKVCRKKGCWMTLKGANQDIRVTFENYGFFVPISIVGKLVVVEGHLESKKMSLKETKHFVEDEGGDPGSVNEPRTEYRFTASGVLVKG